MEKFLKKIYVNWEYGGTEDPYLVAHERIHDIAEVGREIRVGVYELKHTVKIRTHITVYPKIK